MQLPYSATYYPAKFNLTSPRAYDTIFGKSGAKLMNLRYPLFNNPHVSVEKGGL
jgi:hypothetical protein